MFALPIARKSSCSVATLWPRVLGLRGREADARDLGGAVRDAWDVDVVDVRHGLAGDPFGDRVALGERDVRELERRRRHVSHRPDVLDVGPQLAVDVHEPLLVDRDARLLEAEPVGHGSATDRDEADVGGHLVRLALRLERDVDRLSGVA